MKKFVAVAVFAFAFAFAAVASAVSATEIYTPATGFLKVGSGMGAKVAQMPNVMAAQTALNACTGSNLVVDGKFGPLTTGVFKAFQASKGIAADGVIGPITAGQLAACSTTTTPGNPSTPSTTINGTQGSIESSDVAASDESEINEGESDVEIYAVDFELDDDGDLAVQSVDVWFAATTTGSESNDPTDYFKTVSLLVDGKEIKSVDADSSSDWSDDTDGNVDTSNTGEEYRIRFTGLNFVMEADETTKLSVAVSAANTIDGDDDGETWNVAFGNIRTIDGSGFMSEYNESTDLEDSFTIGSNAEEADLTVREGDNSPEATVISVDESNDTNDVTIYAFEIEEDNNVDATIEEMTLTFAITDPSGGVAVSNESAVIRRAYIYQGTNKVGDEAMTASGVVVFDNMNIEIDGNDTEEFTVRVDLEDTNNDARYDQGTLVEVEVTSVDKAEDANGNDEDEMSVTVSGASEEHELRTEGVMLKLISVNEERSKGDASVTGSTDKGTFTIVFEAKAFGADQRIDKTTAEGVAASTTAGQGVLFSTTADDVVTSSLTSSTTDTEDNSNVFELDENATRRFTLTVVVTSTDDLSKVVLETLNYGSATNNTNAEFYTFNLDEFKTDELFLETY